jgi:hypothetical protein
MPRSESAEMVDVTRTALDAAALDDVLVELRGIAHLRGLERTLAIGELLLTRFYADSVVAWRERRRNKLNSIRRLAARSDCPFSKSALNDAVATFVMVRQLPSVRTLRHVGASHIAVVLALNAAQAGEMLAQAEAECWSVRLLKQRVASLPRLGVRDSQAPHEAPPSPSAVLRRRFEQLVRAVDKASETVHADATLAATADWLAGELLELATRLRAMETGPGVAGAHWRPRAERSA